MTLAFMKQAVALLFIYNYAIGFKLPLRPLVSPISCKRADARQQICILQRRQQALKLSTEPGIEPGTGRFGSTGRLLLSGIALAGAAETALLTYSKLSSTSLGNFCSSPESCSSVLSGPYSTIPFLNIPLSAAAFIGYSVVAGLSLLPYLKSSYDTPQARSVILLTSSGMAAFSVYLMVLLATVIQTPCNFCYLSATLSFLMIGITSTQRIVENPTKSFLISASSASISFVVSIFLFYTTSTLIKNSALAESESVAVGVTAVVADAKSIDKKPPQEAPKIKNSSSPRALLIGERLHALNAKMYGAFWCSHCNNQKQELGIEAAKLFEYVECAKDGVDSKYSVCKDEKIPGFPTWQINGQLFPGEKDLSELEKLLDAIEKTTVVMK